MSTSGLTNDQLATLVASITTEVVSQVLAALTEGEPAKVTQPKAAPKRSKTAAPKTSSSTVLPDPSTVPVGTEAFGLKVADGKKRQPHNWVVASDPSGRHFWKFAS